MERITQEQLDAARNLLTALMIGHIGPDKKIGMGELYEAVFQGKKYSHRINDTRLLRRLITEMRAVGMPIVSDGAGYWLSASSSELNQYCDKTKRRALGMLARCSRMKKVSLPEYLGQMRLELEADDETPKA
jgi:hypothetical protein